MRTQKLDSRSDPRLDRAIAELEQVIRDHFPSTTFEITEGDDPHGTYVWATVDVEDTDEVMDVVIDRLLEWQVDEGLPLYFVPTRRPAGRDYPVHALETK